MEPVNRALPQCAWTTQSTAVGVVMPKEPSTSGPGTLVARALEIAAKERKVKDFVLVDEAAGPHPTNATQRVHHFTLVSAADANGERYTLALDDSGRRVALGEGAAASGHPLSSSSAPPPFAGITPAILPAAAITVQPSVNTLTLNQGDTHAEVITVTVPKNAGTTRADVYFLADTTGSMGGILNAVKAGASNILTALNGLALDIAFGVGNYKDFPNDPYAFQHQLSPTNTAASVTGAINAWNAAGGSDGPEGQLFALDRLAVPPGGTIGWRTGAKRVVVWFGDMPGHDPICAALSGGGTITEASVTAKLVAEGITVLAISTANPGLDGDPKSGARDYVGACGAPGGNAGQGTRLATATSGTFVTGINPGNVVATIIKLVTATVASINNVRLVPAGATAPFVSSIAPPGGYGPLSGDQEYTLKFEVKFTGVIPCRETTQVFNGTIDVVADGVIVAGKRVQVTVPACVTKEAHRYSVKFVCGTQADCAGACAPVRAGAYATEINLYNFNNVEAEIEKRFVPVVFAGAPIGREPKAVPARAVERIKLPPRSATMDDCCRIAEVLLGGKPGMPLPLTIGFLEISSPVELSVTAVYTASNASGGGVSIDVQQVAGTTVRQRAVGPKT